MQGCTKLFLLPSKEILSCLLLPNSSCFGRTCFLRHGGLGGAARGLGIRLGRGSMESVFGEQVKNCVGWVVGGCLDSDGDEVV